MLLEFYTTTTTSITVRKLVVKYAHLHLKCLLYEHLTRAIGSAGSSERAQRAHGFLVHHEGDSRRWHYANDVGHETSVEAAHPVSSNDRHHECSV